MRRLPARGLEIGAAHRAWPTREEVASPQGSMEVHAPASVDLYKQAYLEGFDAGHADGDRAARAALAGAEQEARALAEAAREAEENWRDRLASMTQHFAQIQAQLHEEMETLAVEIAFAATCRMVGELHAKHELVAAFCREAVAALHLTPAELRLSPSDYLLLAEGNLGMPCVADPTMQTGGCVIVTSLGEVDVGVETRLQAVMHALLDTLRGNEVAP